MSPHKVFTLRRPLSYSEKVDALWTPRHNQPGALGGFSVVLHVPWFLAEHASRIFSPRNLLIKHISDPNFTFRKFEYAGNAIEVINNAEWRITQEPSGRQHTNITNLLSDIRQFVRIDGKTIVEMDIKSCHPACLIMYLRDEGPSPALALELAQWEEHLRTGSLYEWLCETFGNPKRSRIKKLVMIMINGRPHHAVQFWAWMRERFPPDVRSH